MDTQLTYLFDEFNLEEVSGLLEKEISFDVDAKTASRIKALTFQKAEMKKRRFWVIYSKQFMAATAVVLMLVTTGFTGYRYYQTPVSYLDVDINPSIELGINRWDRIVSAQGYNGDGEKVLADINVINDKVETGVKKIVETADDKGYFSKPGGGAVALTSVSDDNDKAEKLTKDASEAAETFAKEEAVNVEIVTEHVASERRDEAQKIGITPGKLNLIQKLQALDHNITVEDYKEKSVKEILRTIKELKKAEKSSQKTESKTDNEEKQSVDKMQPSDLENETKSFTKDKDEDKDVDEDKENNSKQNHQDDKENNSQFDSTSSKKGNQAEKSIKISSKGEDEDSTEKGAWLHPKTKPVKEKNNQKKK